VHLSSAQASGLLRPDPVHARHPHPAPPRKGEGNPRVISSWTSSSASTPHHTATKPSPGTARAARRRGAGPIPLSNPRDGWFEQDPRLVGLRRRALRGLSATPPAFPRWRSRTSAKTFGSSTRTGRALRPAMVWLDERGPPPRSSGCPNSFGPDRIQPHLRKPPVHHPLRVPLRLARRAGAGGVRTRRQGCRRSRLSHPPPHGADGFSSTASTDRSGFSTWRPWNSRRDPRRGRAAGRYQFPRLVRPGTRTGEVSAARRRNGACAPGRP
jgi:hypothetical protein